MPERLFTEVSATNPLFFKKYEVLVDSDPGGRAESTSPFINTEVLVKPSIEVTYTVNNTEPSVEIVPQIKEYPDKFDTQNYLSQVDEVQRVFDHIFEKSIGILNYNPVLEIAKSRTLQKETEKGRFREYEKAQIATALRERYQAATSTVFYEVDEDNKLRSQKLSNQTFEQVLQTGIEYYKSLNSPDVPRIEKEREGFLKIQQHLTNPNTPLNTKITVISGPGQVEGTIFKDNFLDRYEVIENPFTKKKVIKMTRFASNKTYEQYKEDVLSKKADYFDGQNGPIDEWFLSNPILGEILIENEKALREEKMQKIIQETAPHVDNLVDKICESIFDPKKINDALKAVLNKADFVWESLQSITQKVTSFVSKVREKVMPIFKTFAEEIYWLSQLPVRAVAAGCGLSAAYSSLGKGIRLDSLVLGISLGQNIAIGGSFGFTGESGNKGKTCISCGEVNYCTKRCYKCEGMLV